MSHSTSSIFAAKTSLTVNTRRRQRQREWPSDPSSYCYGRSAA